MSPSKIATLVSQRVPQRVPVLTGSRWRSVAAAGGRLRRIVIRHQSIGRLFMCATNLVMFVSKSP